MKFGKTALIAIDGTYLIIIRFQTLQYLYDCVLMSSPCIADSEEPPDTNEYH